MTQKIDPNHTKTLCTCTIPIDYLQEVVFSKKKRFEADGNWYLQRAKNSFVADGLQMVSRLVHSMTYFFYHLFYPCGTS